MGITVVSQSSEERDDEIKQLFEKMKPHLLEGKSYNQALCIVLGTKNQVYTRRRWYRDLLEYGEKEGFRKDDCSALDKSGLMNVYLGTYSTSLTGHYWIYSYFEDGRKRKLSSIDLNKLRERVEEKGLQWRVVNEFKAQKSYELNRELLLNKRDPKNRNNKSGVKYVSHTKHKQSSKGYYWIYKYNGITIQATSLKKLEDKVKDKNINWIITDNDLYLKNIRNDY